MHQVPARVTTELVVPCGSDGFGPGGSFHLPPQAVRMLRSVSDLLEGPSSRLNDAGSLVLGYLTRRLEIVVEVTFILGQI